MSLANEVDDVFRREVKSLPAFEKAQAASGSGVAPPVDEMNQLLMGLVIAAQRSLHLLADRIIRAADRGVRVRVLLDDLSIVDRDTAIARLSAHPTSRSVPSTPFAAAATAGGTSSPTRRAPTGVPTASS